MPNSNSFVKSISPAFLIAKFNFPRNLPTIFYGYIITCFSDPSVFFCMAAGKRWRLQQTGQGELPASVRKVQMQLNG